jgi:hypothetical protein
MEATRQLAENAGEADRITILSIEEFVAQNILEIAAERETPLFHVLNGIVELYNERIEQAETDQSLRIDLD